jgi:hypothetical protein
MQESEQIEQTPYDKLSPEVKKQAEAIAIKEMIDQYNAAQRSLAEPARTRSDNIQMRGFTRRRKGA